MAQQAEGPQVPNHGPLTIRLAHLSDIHFGKISHLGIVEALVEEVNDAKMDVVIVSGDLTQRATDDQYQDAKGMLNAFEAPVLVVPGNHDVRQFWHNPIERVITPTVRFERYISEELTPTFSTDGLSIFGMNTAHGLTIKGGLVRKASLDAMQTYFASRPEDDLKILVVHHQLMGNQAVFERKDIATGALKAVEAAEASGVDLVLCGHYHISNVTAYPQEFGHEIVVAAAGTATSSRGRGDDKAVNMYNWITTSPDSFSIEERKFDSGTARFFPERTTTFARN